MNYITHINILIRSRVAEKSPLVMFGQNIAAGSCISGLTKGLKSDDSHYVLNTPNCENTLVGTGFGLMLSGVSSIFFMKQQDFLLLGIDQLVNTYNIMRSRKIESSFTIVNVIVDSGYEGPQSSLNNFYDFCSVARIPGYAVSNKHDSEVIIGKHLIAPGFRIIGISQRLCRQELLQVDEEVSFDKNGEIFQYSDGGDLTVVCFNYAFPQGLELCKDFKKRNIDASLFSVNAMLPVDWKKILDNVKMTKKLVVLDDSKSVNSPAQHFIIAAQQEIIPGNLLYFSRKNDDLVLGPNADQFTIDHEAVIAKLGFTSK
jgi:pyruvate dehydrogenase E1 component beta subunit